jgi:hypothetical protein
MPRWQRDGKDGFKDERRRHGHGQARCSSSEDGDESGDEGDHQASLDAQDERGDGWADHDDAQGFDDEAQGTVAHLACDRPEARSFDEGTGEWRLDPEGCDDGAQVEHSRASCGQARHGREPVSTRRRDARDAEDLKTGAEGGSRTPDPARMKRLL